MEIIACHNCADFDTFASMVAAKKVYPEAHLVFAGYIDRNVREFMTLHRNLISTISFKELQLDKIKKCIIVDTKSPDRLGQLNNILNNPEVEIHVYDHHPSRQNDIVGTFNIVKSVGAATTILVDIIKNNHISIVADEATLFAIGIYEDTGALTFSNTTPLDVEMISFLLSNGARLDEIGKYINHPLSEEQRELFNKLILSAETFNFSGFQVVITNSEVEKYIPKLALLTHKLTELERKDAFFSIVRMKDKIYIVGRSTNSSIDVSQIVRTFGGGGHTAAASATIKDNNIKKIKNTLLSVLKRNIKPALLSQDIMSFPVKTVKSDLKVGEAIEISRQHGHRGLIIEQDGKISGIISLNDLRKATEHGLLHAPIKAFMTKDFVIASTDMPVSKLQELMIEKQVDRIPILLKDKLVGIVTSTDIIRSFHRNILSNPYQFNIHMEELGKLPPVIQTLLRKAGKAGDEESLPIYAVGGFVRDLILGEENFDLDLVVEGDGIEYAQKIANVIGGEVKCHEQFGTAELTLSEGYKVDIASARSEFYTKPGALPKIRYSSIKQDMFRRDFTINAMALGLNSDNFGQVIDFFRGKKDLESGLVRVLHNLSFIDDPTRILRAIKFEQRYYFTIEPHTERLIKNAINNNNVMNEIPVERFVDEFIMILNEASPPSSIKRMYELGVLKTIHPDIIIDSNRMKTLNEVNRILNSLHNIIKYKNISKWLIYFLTITVNLTPEEVIKIAKKLKFKTEIVQKITFQKNKEINLSLPMKIFPSEIYRELSDMSIEFIIYLMAQTRNICARERIINYLTKWKYVKPCVNGDDIIKMGYKPGPFFKEILSQVRDATLDGKVRNREESLEFIRQLLEVKKEVNGMLRSKK